MSKLSVKNWTLKEVALGEIRIPEHAQRRFNQAWADFIYSNFDFSVAGIPALSFRDGEYWAVDGQHTIDALKRIAGKDWEIQKIGCRVYTDLTLTQESRLFVFLNTRKQVNGLDMFLNKVRAGIAPEVAINKLLINLGLKVSRQNAPGAVRCVASLLKIFKRAGAGTLVQALVIARDAYGDCGFDSHTVEGLGLLSQRYGKELKTDVVVSILRDAHGGVKGLYNAGQRVRETMGGSLSTAIAAAAVDILNKKLPRKDRLFPWTWGDESEVESEAA